MTPPDSDAEIQRDLEEQAYQEQYEEERREEEYAKMWEEEMMREQLEAGLI